MEIEKNPTFDAEAPGLPSVVAREGPFSERLLFQGFT